MIKTQKTRNKGEINLIRVIYQNPTTNIMLNGNQLNEVEIKNKSMCPFLFSLVLEVLANAVRQEKGMKGIWVRKEEVKWSSLK